MYGIAPARRDPVARAWAAVLACGDHAVLSHMSAASLWGMVNGWGSPLEVTAPIKRSRPGIRTHRCTTLTRRDRTHNLGVPVTSRARTLLDIASDLPEAKLRRIVNDGRRDGLLRDAAIKELLERQPRHPGATRVGALLDSARKAPTRSELEDRFLAFIAEYDLPQPLVNVQLNGTEVDFLFPEHRLIVELDGWAFHRSREQFATDRERDAMHLQHGHPTVRLTWERLTETPAAQAGRLHDILRSRQR